MRLVLILTFLPCLLASSVRSAEADEAHMMARALAVDDEYSYSYEYIVAVNTPAPSPAPTSSPVVLAVTLTVVMECADCELVLSSGTRALWGGGRGLRAEPSAAAAAAGDGGTTRVVSRGSPARI